MDLEEIIWGYFPLLIALIEVVVTIKFLLAKPVPANALLGFLIISLNTFSIYLLIRMLIDGNPSYTPHIALSIATVLLFIQRRIVK
ncbi:hypothetical protein [Robiginitalea sp. IMCC43444]|uniref:hypothetical protein n=1 Tax=Robiginitalea sp. IMCC43444 TaxID=3459121 RepID=UPI0040428B9F